MKWFRYVLLLGLAMVLSFGKDVRGAGTNQMVWHKTTGKVDADITSWDVLQLLENVSSATGWKVYLDPRAIHKISAKFSDLPTGEALHALLGNLNFVVVPQTNAPSLLYVFRTTRDQATRLIHPVRKSAEPVPNQLVVTLKPGAKTKIEDLARSLGAKIVGRMDDQNAYLLEFPDAATTQAASVSLLNNPDVASVGNNFYMEAPPTPAGSENGLPELKLQQSPTNGNCPIVVGLIDTQVQSLAGNLNTFLKPSINATGEDVTPSTSMTHGTAMAETILDAIQNKTGGSTSVMIQPVNVYDSGDSTTTFNVASGIIQAVNSGANILNLSLGGTGDSQLLHDTINSVLKQGIPIYAAAGNTPVTTPTYPAAYAGVIAVTATDSTGQIASYANRGSFIDIAAPGDNVVPFDGQQYTVEGTSTSTAFISGAAAGLTDAAHACPSQAQTLLQKSLFASSILKNAQ